MIPSVAWAVVLVALSASAAGAQGMLTSKHNLSVSGPGPVKATSETQVCVFCHTPHNASPSAPLWNRTLSGQTYTPYASTSLQAAPGQPNGYSRLCLSCHDGSIAIGSVSNLGGQSATIQMQGTGPGGVMPSGSTLIGTTLTNDHPVSFVFNASLASTDGELVDPATLTGAIRLYTGANAPARDSVQCTTCHDPHLTVNQKFLRRSFTGQTQNLCLTCHVKPGWQGSSHESAIKVFGTTTVADLSCSACHSPHTDAGAPRLLRSAVGATAPAIEQTCYRCHRPSTQGGVTYDLQTQFAKTASLHRITAYAGHEPVFTTAGPPENVLNAAKHVECVDCHNPHRVRRIATAATGGVYEGMRGIALGGTTVDDVTLGQNLTQYQICFRCHGDTYATAVGTSVDGEANGVRQAGAIPTSNKRLEFQTTNSAYHPVAGAGRNNSSNLNAQLTQTWSQLTVTSTVFCTDCHNNDFYSGSAFLGPISRYYGLLNREAQPFGPHGSTWFNILRARFWNARPGPTTWSSANFDLCFHCHDVSRLVTAQSFGDNPPARTNFSDEGGPANGRGKDNLHKHHLQTKVREARVTCKECHDNIHSNRDAPNTQYRITGSGTTYTSPNDFTNATGIVTRMVNFAPGVRAIGGRARPEWEYNTATKERRCWLQCHDRDGNLGAGFTMNGFGYRPPSGDLTGPGS